MIEHKLIPGPQRASAAGIDLRSDTVTLPSLPMRQAMAMAEVGDDVFGDDPTVRALEEQAAALLGKEAALFVTSGTQGNLLAVLSHCQRGDEIVVGDQAHIFYYEVAGAAALAGVQMHTVPNQPDGTITPTHIAQAIRGDNIHFPRTALLCLENTHNRCGGAVLSASQMADMQACATHAGLPLHLDGARLFNAAVAQGVPVRDLAAHATTVTFCLSKGLGAPVGSVLCGPAPVLARARKWRKMVGGGLRQAGVLAAAGVFALSFMVDRLADDHANAHRLGGLLATVPGMSLAFPVHTNIVVADIGGTTLSADAFLQRLTAAGVLGVGFGGTLVRFVTHFGIEAEDIDVAGQVIRDVVMAG